MNTPEKTVNVSSVYLEHKENVRLFGPGSMDIHSHKNLATALEISLYALFISFITVMMLLPNHPGSIRAMFPNVALSDPIGFVLWIKMALFIASLVPLFWALHQSSKRLRGRLSRVVRR
jgi:hypothetical protein